MLVGDVGASTFGSGMDTKADLLARGFRILSEVRRCDGKMSGAQSEVSPSVLD